MRGEGRIFRTKGSRFWHFAFCQDGKEIRESSGSEDEAVARRALSKAIGKAENGNYVAPREVRLKFDEMAADLANYYKIKGKASGSSLPYFLKHLQPVFGLDRARRITADRVRQYTADRLDEGAKPASVNKELGALRRMFTLAIKSGRLSRGFNLPTIELLTENNTRSGFVEPADFTRLCSALPDYLQDPVSFLYASSWRVGEMRTLEWRDVDRDLTAIRLRPEVSKNRRARTLGLDGDLLDIMQRASNVRRLECPFVFHHDGKPIGDFRKPWHRASREAGLAGILIHDLRRSGIRNSVRAGVSDTVVMTMSGHRTRAVFDRYNISSVADTAEAARKTTEYRKSQ
jgi:integrase